MNIINIIFEFIKNIFTWPIITFVLVTILLIKYHEAISKFICNIKSLKGPGVEITQEQKIEIKNEPQIEKVEIDRLTTELNQVRSNNAEKEQFIEEARLLIPQLASGFQFYKFEYLNLFYVANTKNILEWFNNVSVTTKDQYQFAWYIYIKDIKQLKIIIEVLILHNMLQVLDNDRIAITDEGRQFVSYVNKKYSPKFVK